MNQTFTVSSYSKSTSGQCRRQFLL